MTLLAIETSCDETSAAVVRDGEVLSNIVSSQVKLHAEYGGVVPELATREHLRNLLPGVRTALLVGFKAAQAVAFALRKPFVGVHHHEAHLYSPWISGSPPQADFGSFQPNVSLIVSGGHTMLVHVEEELSHRVLGSTVDDAAGECFDKVARLIGLSYPGGPLLDRLAGQGNAQAFDFPRPMQNDTNDDFSFSGLKTSV